MTKRKPGKVIQKVDIRTSTDLVRGVPLRLVTDAHFSQKTPTFSYLIDIDAPVILRVEAKDPTECVKLAQAKLEDALGLSWTDELEVEIDEHDGFLRGTEDGVSLAVSYRRIQTACRRGAPVYRERQELGDPVQAIYEIARSGLGARVPDTDENRARVQAIVDGARRLREQLRDLLSPKKIAQTLNSVDALPLLEAPKTKGRKPRSKA